MVVAPVIMDTRQAQIDTCRALCDAVDRLGHGAQVIADEWCNTLDDVRDFADAGAGNAGLMIQYNEMLRTLALLEAGGKTR